MDGCQFHRQVAGISAPRDQCETPSGVPQREGGVEHVRRTGTQAGHRKAVFGEIRLFTLNVLKTQTSVEFAMVRELISTLLDLVPLILWLNILI